MEISREARLLRIFIGEHDRCQGRPLFEWLVQKAHEMDLAGATVLRGPLGFGASHELHTEKILRLSENLPVVVEIIDSPEKIEPFWTTVQPMCSSGLVTLEKVTILRDR